MESLFNKVILITGASSGIGGHTAKMLAKFKPRLALVARSADKLKHVQSQCEQLGCGQGNSAADKLKSQYQEAGCGQRKVLTITADVGKQEDLSRVISDTVKAFGQLDVLVNNAAAFVYNDVETTKPEAFDRTMAVNIRAPFFLCQAAIPHLKKTAGSIINISSVSAQNPFYQGAAYSVSKAALEHFTRNLALELAPSGVRVNAITVGPTVTDTQLEMMEILGKPKLGQDVLLKLQPLGGMCSMEDIGKVVTFLASDLSAAMTGTCIPVDRGFSLVSVSSQMVGNMEEIINVGDTNPIPTQDMVEHLKVMAKAKEAENKPSES